MAVAFDAFSSVAEGTGTLSWTHTPVGTPKAVRVDVVENGGTNGVSAVTYGGVAMELVAVNSKTSGEAGTVVTYFLGKNIPTGAQTVSVTVSDAVAKRAGATTITASTATTCWIAADGSVGSDSLANPTSTLSLRGKTCFVSIAAHSGQNAVTGITPSSGWTSRLEHDFGNQTAAWYTYNTVSTSDVACGWTQTADDAVMIALAITEAPLASESVAVGLTESASITVVFDSRALPIIITEAALVTVVLSAADSPAVQLTEAAAVLVTVPAVDSTATQLGDVGGVIATSSLSLSVTDSLAIQTTDASRAIQSTSSNADSCLVGLSDARAVVLTDTGALVVEGHDTLAVVLTESINNLTVFVPGNTQNYVVSDSLKVQLNGEGPPPTAKSATDSLSVGWVEPTLYAREYALSESLATQAGDVAAITAGLNSAFSVTDSASVSLSETVSQISAGYYGTDSLSIQLPEDVPDVATVIVAVDALRVSLTELSDQYAQLAVSDSVAVPATGEVSQIVGLLMFTVTDSLTVQASDVSTLGTIAVKTSDVVSLQFSEVVMKAANLAVTESLSTQLAEVATLFNTYAVADSLAVRLTDAATPIFSNFFSLTAADACAVQASDVISNLVSFLTQVTATDSLTVQADDASTGQSVTLSANDACAVQADETPDILVTFTVTESLKIGTTELGLAIPIVSVNVSTFAGDTVLGFDDQAALSELDSIFDESLMVQIDGAAAVTVSLPSAETVAAVLLEALRLDLSGALTESNTCGLLESATVAVMQTATDALAYGADESSTLQPGYYFDDACAVDVTEGTASYAVVANSSPDTWHGDVGTEHRHEHASPGKYRFRDTHEW